MDDGASRPTAGALPRLLPETAVALLALVVGSVQLGSRSLWYDESFSVSLAEERWSVFWHHLTGHEANQAAYFLALRLWPLGGSEAAVRSLSVVLSAAAAVVLCRLGTRLADRWVGVAAGAVFATTPFALQAAQEARGYSFLALGSATATLSLVRAVQEPSRRNWVWYAVAAGLLPYVHVYGALVTVGHLPYGIRRGRKAFGASLAAATALASPMALWLVREHDSGRLDFLRRLDREHLREAGNALSADSAVLLVLIAVATVVGSVLAVRRGFGLVLLPWLLLTPLALVVVSLAWSPVYQVRYLAACTPALALAVGAGVCAAGDLRIRSAALGGLVLVSLAALPGHLGPLPREDWRAVAAYLQESAGPGDVIVPSPCYEHIGLLTYSAGIADRLADGCQVVPAQRLWVVGRRAQLAPAGYTRVLERRFDDVRVELFVRPNG